MALDPFSQRLVDKQVAYQTAQNLRNASQAVYRLRNGVLASLPKAEDVDAADVVFYDGLVYLKNLLDNAIANGKVPPNVSDDQLTGA